MRCKAESDEVCGFWRYVGFSGWLAAGWLVWRLTARVRASGLFSVSEPEGFGYLLYRDLCVYGRGGGGMTACGMRRRFVDDGRVGGWRGWVA